MTSLVDVPDEVSFRSTITQTSPTTLTVLYFHAPWAAPCAQMHTILTTLAQTYQVTSPPSIQFLSIDAEALPEISEDYDVTAVPYLALLRDGKTVDTVSGCDATKVREAVEKHHAPTAAGESGGKNGLPPVLSATRRADDGQEKTNGTADLSSYAPSSGDPTTAPAMTSSAISKESATQTSQEDINARLTNLVKAAPVMLFMKGTPSNPQCGFSRQLVGFLRERSVRYGFFNILADEDVRQGLKVFADWPTYPQLWVGGELVGGLDIVSAMTAFADSVTDLFDR